MPASATARAVASGCQYMSQKRVVPVRIISSAGEPRAPVDVLGVELRLDRPDPLSQPGHQRQVAAAAAEERHRRVGVAVDAAAATSGAPPASIVSSPGCGADLGPERRDQPVGAAHADASRRRARRAGDASAAPSLTGRPRPSCGRTAARPSRSCAALASRSASSSATLELARRRARWRGCRRRRAPRSRARARRRRCTRRRSSSRPRRRAAAISRISAGVSKRGPIVCQ